jgi:hypothetical protein
LRIVTFEPSARCRCRPDFLSGLALHPAGAGAAKVQKVQKSSPELENPEKPR